MASSGQVSDQAFVTLATNDNYALGAIVLAHSLRRVSTTRHIAIMISSEVSAGIRQQLNELFDLVTDVNVLDSRDQVNLSLLTRPDLGITFTKLHCWRLTQYHKCVFLDADTLVLQNVDELFEREELSAAPDAGWPDCFNSGVFVFVPSLDTYQRILAFATEQGSFDGGDQGLLNMYYSSWATQDIHKHLPFTYNVVSQAFYSYLPAFRHYGKNIKICHFIGRVKPWHHTFNMHTNRVEVQDEAGHCADFLQQWWELFMARVQPKLSNMEQSPPVTQSYQFSEDGSKIKSIGGVYRAPVASSSDSSGAPVYTEVQLADESRQFAWERGQIDYMGIDSFENIEHHIKKMMSDSEYNKDGEPVYRIPKDLSVLSDAVSSESGSSEASGAASSGATASQAERKQPKPILKK